MLKRVLHLKNYFRVSAQNQRYFSTVDGKPCTSCGGKNFVMRFVCGKCHILQDPKTNIEKLNYFQIFHLPISYEIDKKKMDQEFRALQMFFHPDKINASPSGAQSSAERYSAVLNEAYSTLKDDTARAIYILGLNGFQFEEGNRMTNFEFMEEILEKREQIENSKDKNEITEIKEENDGIMQTYMKDISEKLKEKNYKEALELIERFKYFGRINEAIETWFERHHA